MLTNQWLCTSGHEIYIYIIHNYTVVAAVSLIYSHSHIWRDNYCDDYLDLPDYMSMYIL